MQPSSSEIYQNLNQTNQNLKENKNQNLQLIHKNSQISWIDVKFDQTNFQKFQSTFQSTNNLNSSLLSLDFGNFIKNLDLNLENIIKKSFQFLAILLVVFSLVNSNLFGRNAVFAQDTSILKTKYEQRKSEIDKKQGEISKNLNEVTGKYQSSNTQEKNLKVEIAKQKGEIEKVENQITESKVVINQIDEQIKKNEVQIAEIKKQVGVIVVEIQKQERISPLQTVLTSNSLEEAMGKMYNLSSLQTQAKTLSDKIETTQLELDRNKTMQVDIQSQLEATKNLLNSRKANLSSLMEQTKEDQGKYEELLKQLEEQKQEFEKKQNEIGGEYLAEVKRAVDEQKQKDTIRENTLKEQELNRQKEAEEAKNKQNSKNNEAKTDEKSDTNNPVKNDFKSTTTTPNTASPSTPKTAPKTNVGSSGCRFEAGGLNVAPGYFGPVTNGYVSQTFHCGHDGTDISSGLGTSLFALAKGVVVKKGAPVNCTGFSCNGGFGNYVVVQHDLPSGDTAYALYAHMQSASPKSIGQNVSKGEVVGSMGCTGYTLPYPCGVHVHFMLLADISSGISCLYGSTKCYNPQRYISQIA